MIVHLLCRLSLKQVVACHARCRLSRGRGSEGLKCVACCRKKVVACPLSSVQLCRFRIVCSEKNWESLLINPLVTRRHICPGKKEKIPVHLVMDQFYSYFAALKACVSAFRSKKLNQPSSYGSEFTIFLISKTLRFLKKFLNCKKVKNLTSRKRLKIF